MILPEVAFQNFFAGTGAWNIPPSALHLVANGRLDSVGEYKHPETNFLSGFSAGTLPVVPVFRYVGERKVFWAGSLGVEEIAREFFEEVAGPILWGAEHLRTNAALRQCIDPWKLRFFRNQKVNECEYDVYRHVICYFGNESTGAFVRLEGIGLFLTLGAGLFSCRLSVGCGLDSSQSVTLSTYLGPENELKVAVVKDIYKH